MKKVFFREAIARALAEEMARDERVILLGQDVGAFGGSYKETLGLHARFGAARVRDMPVAEAATVGIAVGAAARGLRPVAFITYMDFLTLGLDPLVNYGAKIRYKTGGQLQAPLVIKATAGAKGQGVAHSQSFDAWLMSVPGLKVVVPSTPRDAYGLLKSAIRDGGPVVFVDHKRLFPTAGEVPDDEEHIPFGVAAVRRRGNDLTIVSHGYMATVALEGAAALDADGVSSEVIDLRTLSPLDVETVRASAARTGAALFVEEGQAVCGVGAELAFVIREHAPSVRTARLAARPAPISSNPVFEAYCLPDAARVRSAALALLRGK
ncbi:MAG: alpha-ketoacid dehydrogenase subunit beta [Polyangiaceae bacterium]